MGISTKSLLHGLGACLLVALAVVAARPRPARMGTVTWTMLDAGVVGQADAHLIELPGPVRFLVDTADRGDRLVAKLRARGIRTIDRVIISHGHRDHYGGLLDIVRAGIEVREVRFNFPVREVCDAERPWGCDHEDLLRTRRALAAAGIPVRPIARGDLLYAGPRIRLEALYAFDGRDTPVGRTDVNDMSVLLRLEANGRSALFTGDLNAAVGGWLAANGTALAADVLKVPHHGAESTVPDAFFAKVGAKAALVPAPSTLWTSERSRRVRAYFQAHQVPVYVAGIDGDVLVRFIDEEFQIERER